jgi:hypothetical protein
VATHRVCVTHVCRVVRLFPLQGCILIQISVTPTDMGEVCLLCLNIVMELHCGCSEIYEDDIDYFVVMD